jgi:hypothetical protein
MTTLINRKVKDEALQYLEANSGLGRDELISYLMKNYELDWTNANFLLSTKFPYLGERQGLNTLVVEDD